MEEMLADLPRECAAGCKTNSHGRMETWRGYKLHLDVADGQIPISAVLTAANLHDCQVAIPLATMTAQRRCQVRYLQNYVNKPHGDRYDTALGVRRLAAALLRRSLLRRTPP